MKKVYELWLDESGKFVNEGELRNRHKKPSLVGGFLVESDMVDQIPYDEIIDSQRNHATELTGEDKREYVLPTLETMQTQYYARQVFFENAEYVDINSGRQLYLRIIAEGLLQLMQTLNAQSESVELKVLIAQRQDMEAPEGHRRILSAEYQNELGRQIAKKKKENRIFLHENSSLNYRVAVANRDYKLQLADFACNTRLTRDSAAFSDNNVRARVSRLYDDAYIFSLSEINSENYIKRSLANGYISDAIMELYTTTDQLNHEKELSLIMERMKNTNYRLIKSQMKQCISDITAFAAKEDDYEIGEKFLKNIGGELVPALQNAKQPYRNLKFATLLQLVDMYLREGDIIAARETVDKCREAQQELGNNLEETISYYQLIEKEALLSIDEFDYEKGAAIMKGACDVFQNFMGFFQTDERLKVRFSNLKSEYYGDALCMQIYAMLFLQRRKPEIYEELCRLSDMALTQYPDEEGELERHRQYRSHIELEKGNYETAVLWLLKAKGCHEKEITEKILIEFLNLVTDTEADVSCQYYLMYYLLIVCESQLHNDPIAKLLYGALQKQKKLLSFVGIGDRGTSRREDAQNVDISQAQPQNTDILYHPMEIVYWKYASYLNQKELEGLAIPYYEKAVNICFAERDYLTMYITGLGIEAERISCLLKMGKKSQADNALQELNRKIERISTKKLSDGTKKFLWEFSDCLEPTQEALWNASRMITY